MNTKPFPALTALVAGSIVCIISFAQRVDMVVFARRFIISAIVFFSIGLVIKIILDKNFNVPEEDEDEDNEVNDDNEEFEDDDFGSM